MAGSQTSPTKEKKSSITSGQSMATVSIAPNVPYTTDEVAQLSAQLFAPLDGPQTLLGSASSSQAAAPNPSATVWTQSTLPLLVTLVEKVLQLAAEHYGNGTEANDTKTSSPPNGTSTKEGGRELFLEENAYIVEQLRLQQGPFFTLPRLWEVLADPFKYNCDANSRLRGEKLQSAVRRCVLVSAPLITLAASDTMYLTA